MVMINLQSFGQKATRQEGISNTKSIRGKQMLRKENRIQNATDNLAEKNENRARRKHKLGTLSNYKSQKKMVAKERKKSRKEAGKEEKKQEKTANNKTENKKESTVAMGPEENHE